MRGKFYIAVALLMFCLCRFAAAQPVEVAWELQNNAGGKGEFVQTDEQGYTYVVQSNANSTWSLNVYDVFGDLVRTTPLGYIPVGLLVDYFAGTAFVSDGTSIHAYYWDGFVWTESGTGALLNYGCDAGGRVVIAFADSADGVTNIVTYPDGFNIGGKWSVSYLATAAQVDSEGNVLLVQHTGTPQNGNEIVTLYSESGSQLWTRSYAETLLEGQYFAGFVEDSFFDGYLLINGFHHPSTTDFHVEAIDPTNGASDLWESSTATGNIKLGATDDLNVYCELITGQLVALETSVNNQVGGTVAWTINQPADQLTSANGSGAIIGVYSATANAFEVLNYASGSGQLASSQTVPAASASDEGSLVGGGGYTTYVGATGGTNSEEVVAKLIYGAHLSKVILPSSVVGGSSIPADFTVTALLNDGVDVSVTSNFPKIASPPSLVQLFNLSTVISIPTVAVDADTVVSFTSTEEGSDVRRFSTTTVATAKPASIKPAATSVASGKTTTATITLTGPAGPSGKTVTLSSNDPSALSLPATVSIGAGNSSAVVTLTAHAVAKSTVVTLTAKIGTNDAFGSITVTP